MKAMRLGGKPPSARKDEEEKNALRKLELTSSVLQSMIQNLHPVCASRGATTAA